MSGGPGRSILRHLLPAVVATGLLAGCTWLFVPPYEKLRDLYYVDDFEHDNIWGQYDVGADEGFPIELQPGGGYLLFLAPLQSISPHEAWGGPLEVDVFWSVTIGNAVPPDPQPVPIVGYPDFRIQFNRSGVYAELNLYEDGVDSLSIHEEDGSLLAGPVTMPTLYRTEGQLSVEYVPFGLGAGLYARAPRQGLELSTAIDSSLGDTKLTFWVSGTWDDPRALEAIYVYGE
jgi:hypothetical protein